MNGRVVRAAEANVSLFDRGARDGLGIFETLRVENRQPLDWGQHLERLVLAAAELGYPVPPAPSLLRSAVGELLAAAALDDAAVRITVTRGVAGLRPGRPGCWIDAQPLNARVWRGARTGKARAIVSTRPFEPGAFGRFKTTSRIAYQQAADEARVARADEALLVSPAGELLEGANSNVFLLLDGALVTPPLASGILPGVTRARVLCVCTDLGIPARESRVSSEALREADEVFVTNAVQQVVPLVAVDGRPIPSRATGDRILEAYRNDALRGA